MSFFAAAFRVVRPVAASIHPVDGDRSAQRRPVLVGDRAEKLYARWKAEGQPRDATALKTSSSKG
jgi:hypothetical protein